MDTEITPRVFVLLYYSNRSSKVDPPETIVFSTLPRLQQHVVDLVKKNIDDFDDGATELLRLADNKLYDNFFILWRYLQKQRLCRAVFDVHWDPEPQVVL